MHCCNDLCQQFAWIERTGYREQDGLLQIVVMHSYPPGVEIRKLVRAFLRQWIPRAIEIELRVVAVAGGELESVAVSGAVQTAMTGRIP